MRHVVEGYDMNEKPNVWVAYSSAIPVASICRASELKYLIARKHGGPTHGFDRVNILLAFSKLVFNSDRDMSAFVTPLHCTPLAGAFVRSAVTMSTTSYKYVVLGAGNAAVSTSESSDFLLFSNIFTVARS